VDIIEKDMLSHQTKGHVEKAQVKQSRCSRAWHNEYVN